MADSKIKTLLTMAAAAFISVPISAATSSVDHRTAGARRVKKNKVRATKKSKRRIKSKLGKHRIKSKATKKKKKAGHRIHKQSHKVSPGVRTNKKKVIQRRMKKGARGVRMNKNDTEIRMNKNLKK